MRNWNSNPRCHLTIVWQHASLSIPGGLFAHLRPIFVSFAADLGFFAPAELPMFLFPHKGITGLARRLSVAHALDVRQALCPKILSDLNHAGKDQNQYRSGNRYRQRDMPVGEGQVQGGAANFSQNDNTQDSQQ